MEKISFTSIWQAIWKRFKNLFGKQKKWVRLTVIVALVLLAAFTINHIRIFAINQIKDNLREEVVKPWKKKLEDIKLANKTTVDSLSGVISISTVEKKQLQRYIDQLSEDITTLSDSLAGVISSVHIGTGVVDVDTSGTGTVETDSSGNKALVYADDWVDIKVRDIMKSDPFFWYRFHFNVTLEGVSKVDRYGNTRHVEKVWLVNPNNPSDKKEVKWTSTFVTRKEKIKLFRWWNWKAHSDMLLLGKMQYGLSFSPFTVGPYEWPSTTWAYLLGAGVATDFEKDFMFTLIPIRVNLAQIAPNNIVKNLNASLIIGFDVDGTKSLRLGIGVTH